MGNALEVKEAISVLRGETGGDLLELCLTLGSCILTEAGVARDNDEARAMLQETINSGAALKKLSELVEAQDGEARDVYDTSRLPLAPVQLEVLSDTSGYLSHIECEKVGLISMHRPLRGPGAPQKGGRQSGEGRETWHYPRLHHGEGTGGGRAAARLLQLLGRFRSAPDVY